MLENIFTVCSESDSVCNDKKVRLVDQLLTEEEFYMLRPVNKTNHMHQGASVPACIISLYAYVCQNPSQAEGLLGHNRLDHHDCHVCKSMQPQKTGGNVYLDST